MGSTVKYQHVGYSTLVSGSLLLRTRPAYRWVWIEKGESKTVSERSLILMSRQGRTGTKKQPAVYSRKGTVTSMLY